MEVLVEGASEEVVLLLKEIVKENRTTLVTVTYDRKIANGANLVVELMNVKINCDLLAGQQDREDQA